MGKQYEVKGPVAVVEVAGASRYLYHGAVVPEGATNVDHLLAVGLLGEIEQKSEPAAKVENVESGEGAPPASRSRR